MKSVAFLSPFAVVPPRYGGPLRVFNLCRHLGGQFAVAQFAQQCQRSQLAASLKPAINRVRDGYIEYASRDPLSIALFALTSLVLNCPPVWQSRILHLRPPRWLTEILTKADLVHIEQPWQFGWAWNRIGGRKPIVLGTENVEADLYSTQGSGTPRLLARAIHKIVSTQERFAVGKASKVLAVTEDDASRLRQLYGLDPGASCVVPNGVDCSRFEPSPEETKLAMKRKFGLLGKQVVVFSGSRHFPNIEAANWIIKHADAWQRQDLCFLIVGSVGEAIRGSRSSMVKVTGRVHDTRPYLAAADIAVNPMPSGGGSNLKQLEFMAMGLPTVATKVGVRGIAFEDGVHGFVASPDMFPARLAELADDTKLGRRMGMSSRRLVETEYDWARIADRLSSVYSDVLG